MQQLTPEKLELLTDRDFILNMNHINGFTQIEIAKEIGVGVTTVNKYLKTLGIKTCQQCSRKKGCSKHYRPKQTNLMPDQIEMLLWEAINTVEMALG